jgi:hypothetical protein
MSQRYQGGFITASYNGLKVPDAPTIGTATAGNTTASVTFTAPTNVGGGAITGYTVISSPGGITGTGASSPITVSGLANGTAYTFTVVATNTFGNSAPSAASNSVTPNIPQQVEYTTAGTYTFVAPVGLSPATVSVVCIGGGGGSTVGSGFSYIGNGGGGGGELRYKNGISVTGGSSYTVVVGARGVFGRTDGAQTSTAGGQSSFNSTTCVANGGGRGLNSSTAGAGGSGGTGDGGGNGGAGGSGDGGDRPGGGGGAGGYSGAGGAGGVGNTGGSGSGGANGSGGGSGGGHGGNASFLGSTPGGGTNIGGTGANGAGASASGSLGDVGGDGSVISPDFLYGYGAGAGNTALFGSASPYYGNGYVGAVRIIYSSAGVTRSFPSTNTGNL